MDINIYDRFKQDIKMFNLLNVVDASHLTISSGTHWMELLYARYPSRPKHGIVYFVYLSDLADGEIYRLAITLRHIESGVDRAIRLLPDGTIFRVDVKITKNDYPSASFLPLHVPMGVSSIDKPPSTLVRDWCSHKTGPWMRLPCVRQQGTEDAPEIMVIGYRADLRIDDVDLYESRFGIKNIGGLASCLLDHNRFAKLVARMPPDRVVKNEFQKLQQIFAMVDPRDAPMADDWITRGEAIGYRSRPSAPAPFNVTYTWLYTEPRRGGQKANRIIDPLEHEQAIRLLCSLISILQPGLIVTSGVETARQLPRFLEPLIEHSESVGESTVFERPRHNRLWELHEKVGQLIRRDILVDQQLKLHKEPTHFIPILDAHYWGRESIQGVRVCSGYWESFVRSFKTRPRDIYVT
jgi:hypothetical protein